MRHLTLMLALSLTACAGGDGTDTDPDTDAGDTSVADGPPRVAFTTSLGDFTVELDPEAAPVTVENFLGYVDSGFYDGDDEGGATIFHRVIAGFVAQGGGVLASGSLKTPGSPIVLESDNGLSNLRGTIAMARTNAPDSATTQFYVNLVDNTALDYQSAGNPGYAVFGEVVSGMETIDAIATTETGAGDRPTTDVVITDCERVE